MIEAYPLHWPMNKPRTPKGERLSAKFGRKEKHAQYNWNTTKPLTLSQAVQRVLSELDKYTRVGHMQRVPEESIIISTNVPLRKDGLPRSDWRKPEDPGAAVYFKLDNRDYCLPCDKWDRVEDNIAAIAAHINALRGIERWGVGETHDAYAGFKALPDITMAEKDVWQTLGLSAKPAHWSAVESAYKSMAKKVHPDAGGSSEAFMQLMRAYDAAKNLFK